MRNYLALTAILFKNTFELLDAKKNDKKNTKLKSTLIIGLLIIAFLPTIGMVFFLINSMFVSFNQINQQSFIIMLALHVQSLVVFVFAMFMVPAVFYFAKDVESLLPLPLKPWQIIMAKFTVALIYEYITAFFVIGPLIVSMCINGYFSVGFILIGLVIFITAPILPLIYAIIINMFVIGILHFGKNRDLFNMLAGIFGIAISLVISMGSQRLAMVNPEEIALMLSAGDNTMINILSSVFFNIRFGANALANVSFLDLLIYLGVTILSVAVFNVIAELLYFKGVIGITESSSKHRKINTKELNKNTVKQNSLVAYFIKEMRILVRTPSYFLNCVLVSFIMPLFFIAPMAFSGGGSAEILNLLSSIDFTNEPTIRATTAIIAGVGFLMGSMNFITSSAISREGQNYYVMKYLPISYKTQLNAKAFTGIFVSGSSTLILEIIAVVIIKIPIANALLGVVLSLFGIIIISYLGLIADAVKPNLIWDNEQKAVKQNINGIFTMLAGYALTAVVVLSGFFIVIDPVLFGALLFIILAVLCYVVYKFSINFCVKAIQNL